MNCPICSATMENRGEVRRKIIADFYCFNDACPTAKINYRPHIEVAMIGGKAPWHVLSYHLPFQEWDNSWVVIEGSEKNQETTFYERYSFLMSEKKFIEHDDFLSDQLTTIQNKATVWEMTMMSSVNRFLPLSLHTSTYKKVSDNAKDILWTMKGLEGWEDYASSVSSYTGSGYYRYDPAPPLPAALAISKDDVVSDGIKDDIAISEMGCFY